jgi:hypothetical protein
MVSYNLSIMTNLSIGAKRVRVVSKNEAGAALRVLVLTGGDDIVVPCKDQLLLGRMGRGGKTAVGWDKYSWENNGKGDNAFCWCWCCSCLE